MENEICRLKQEISRLHLLVDQAGISYEQPPVQEKTKDAVLRVPITETQASCFILYFREEKMFTASEASARMADHPIFRNAITSGNMVCVLKERARKPSAPIARTAVGLNWHSVF